MEILEPNKTAVIRAVSIRWRILRIVTDFTEAFATEMRIMDVHNANALHSLSPKAKNKTSSTRVKIFKYFPSLL